MRAGNRLARVAAERGGGENGGRSGRHPAADRPGSGRQGGYFFNSMVTSTSGQRRATGWMDGRAMILVNSLLSVAIDSR